MEKIVSCFKGWVPIIRNTCKIEKENQRAACAIYFMLADEVQEQLNVYTSEEERKTLSVFKETISSSFLENGITEEFIASISADYKKSLYILMVALYKKYIKLNDLLHIDYKDFALAEMYLVKMFWSEKATLNKN